MGIPAKIVVGIGGDHRVKEFLFKGQVGGIGLHRNDLLIRQAHFAEKGAVLLRIAPQVGGIDGKAVFLGQKHRRQPLPAAQIAHHRSRGDAVIRQQFLLQLDGVGAHDLALQGRCIIRFAACIFHTMISSYTIR